jgi:hypothetical protein
MQVPVMSIKGNLKPNFPCMVMGYVNSKDIFHFTL